MQISSSLDAGCLFRLYIGWIRLTDDSWHCPITRMGAKYGPEYGLVHPIFDLMVWR